MRIMQRLVKDFRIVATIVISSSVFGFLAGVLATNLLTDETTPPPAPVAISYEEQIVAAVEKVSPAVVSIIVSKDLPIIGGGSGFIVSADGMVLTNKHVVLDEQAEYTVFTKDGKKFTAKVLARDPVQDLAILKIEAENQDEIFSVAEMGDSDGVRMGQTAIAIGNALGEFKNTVSVGVISGLGRTITASSGNFVETIEDVLQTDAAINKGNSGGPLLDLEGHVIGINTATVLDAQSIGFAIPVNKAKRDIRQIKEIGEIIYPFLGVRYLMLTPELQEENNLSVSEGAWINSDNAEPAIVAGSAAEKAGLKEGDIIIEMQGEKLTPENTLASVIQKYDPGDEVIMTILRGEEKLSIKLTLGKRE